MKARIFAVRSLTERKLPRWMAWRSMMPNQTSTRFSHDDEAGVKCTRECSDGLAAGSVAELAAKGEVLAVSGLQRLVEGVDLGPVLALELADLGGEGTDDVAGLVGCRNGCGPPRVALLGAQVFDST